MKFTIWTIGHSTRSLDAFASMLQLHRIELLVDVRTIPRSPHNPQFNRETLPKELASFSVEYLHMGGLGGLRCPLKDSQNLGWRNASFRGFADYMLSDEFGENLRELLALTRKKRTALMCAESVPWRCHRSLIADALTIRGVKVEHIVSKSSAREHTLSPFASVRGTNISYPKKRSD